ncbi:Uncharacterized protein Adt_34708 [Abeliophyllum distichum]|uniref:Uncharacterized protein n=1 Tax=Abeliophyllum distichum TaxID=126358 RepID=A0ABD1QZV4_9LAMI
MSAVLFVSKNWTCTFTPPSSIASAGKSPPMACRFFQYPPISLSSHGLKHFKTQNPPPAAASLTSISASSSAGVFSSIQLSRSIADVHHFSNDAGFTVFHRCSPLDLPNRDCTRRSNPPPFEKQENGG